MDVRETVKREAQWNHLDPTSHTKHRRIEPKKAIPLSQMETVEDTSVDVFARAQSELETAIIKNSPNDIRKAIGMGADVNQVVPDLKIYPLVLSVYSRRTLEACQTILSFHPKLHLEIGQSGPALYSSVAWSNVEAMRTLILAGADPSAPRAWNGESTEELILSTEDPSSADWLLREIRSCREWWKRQHAETKQDAT